MSDSLSLMISKRAWSHFSSLPKTVFRSQSHFLILKNSSATTQRRPWRSSSSTTAPCNTGQLMGQKQELSSERKQKNIKRTKVAVAPTSDHAKDSRYQVPLGTLMVAQRMKSRKVSSEIQFQDGSTVPVIERLCL